MYRKIDHIGIAVRSLEAALKIYGAGLALKPDHIEEVPGQKTRVAIIPLGEARLELLEAMEEDSPIGKFIAKRGEGWIHSQVRAAGSFGDRFEEAGARFGILQFAGRASHQEHLLVLVRLLHRGSAFLEGGELRIFDPESARQGRDLLALALRIFAVGVRDCERIGEQREPEG